MENDMTAKIFAFPLVRRPHDITLVARNMMGKSPEAAEKYLGSFKARATSKLHSQGLSHDQADRQFREFETAVRCRIWRSVLLGGGAA
jgi:hypothetical protein